jgi:hypothetical protein
LRGPTVLPAFAAHLVNDAMRVARRNSAYAARHGSSAG